MPPLTDRLHSVIGGINIVYGLRPLFRFFEFSGRSGRPEFWQFIAYVFLISSLLTLLELRSSLEAASIGVMKIPIWSSIFSLLVFIPATTASFRRLHDRNKTGWLIGIQIILVLLSIVFLFGGIVQLASGSSTSMIPFSIALYLVAAIVSVYVIVQLVLPGDDFENDYGIPDNEPSEISSRFSRRAKSFPSDERPPTPTARTAKATADHLGTIEKLADMNSRGLLTDEEFSAHKSRLLSEML